MTRDRLVELVATSSSTEAQELVARLARAGINARPNAAPVPTDPAHTGKVPPPSYRFFVVVAEPDRERALEFVRGEQVPEGKATTDEIDSALAEYAQRDRDCESDCDGDGVDDDSDESWQNRVWGERWHRAADNVWRWFAWLGFAVLVSALTYALVKSL